MLPHLDRVEAYVANMDSAQTAMMRELYPNAKVCLCFFYFFFR